ncbi:RFX1 factor, partial [Atlantisia rogersi]|nr:RFX1 factor [Atlantisia rogersi]
PPTPPPPPQVQQLPPVPVQHVYPTPVPYVEGSDGTYPPSTIRSGSYPYAETPLYGQNAGAGYYETSGGGPVQPSPPPPSSQAPAGTAQVPMYVAGGQILGTPGNNTPS